MTAFFTVCNRHQLPGAIALGKSIREHHKGASFIIGWADEVNLPAVPAGIEIIPVSDLDLPQLPQMSGLYYDFELVHALRPWFARHLLEHKPDISNLVFLAPTTMVYRSFEHLFDPGKDLLLTPHIVERLPASHNLDDKRILNIGMFHSNAWIARRSESVKNLLDWWSIRTIDRASFDLCNGMCLDQLWLNYAPVHVARSLIIRDPLWHIGLHNCLLYPVRLENTVPVINGEHAYTVDFAGLYGYHPVWSDHTALVAGRSGWASLLGGYRKNLETLKEFSLPGNAAYGQPAFISSVRNFRRSVKSKLDGMTDLIDQFEI